MQDALKLGVVNRETLGFVLSLLIELSVLATELVLARRGSVPFSSNLVDWIRAQAHEKPRPGRLQLLLRRLAKAVANLFFAVSPMPAARAAAATSTGPGHGGFGPVELAPDPTFPNRKTA